MKKSAVIFTEVYAGGGLERFIFDMTLALRGDWEFHFVFNEGNDRIERFCAEHGFDFSVLPMHFLGPVSFKPLKLFSPLRKYIYFLLNYRKIKRTLQHFSGADAMLVVNGGYPASDACRIASVVGHGCGIKKVLHFVLSTPTVYLKNLPFIKIIEGAIDRHVAAGTDLFVANADAIGIMLDELKGFSSIKTVYTGIGLPASQGTRETVFSTNGFSAARQKDELWLGTVSLLAPLKGHAYLLDAVEMLAEKGINARCIIAGSGPQENFLREEVKERGLSGRVNLIGRISDEEIDRLYRFIDIFVFPSLQEGLPYVVSEAMGYGLPVVAFSVGGVPEQIEDGVTGYLVEAGNSSQFADRIEKLARTPGLLAAFGAGARRKAAEKFSIAAMVSHIKQLL